MKKFFHFVAEVFKIAVLSLLIVLPIRYFVFQPFFVRGQSMEPNFSDRDYLIVDEISYRFRNPKRGEVIVFKYPHNPSQRFIKRIIGLPGETVEIQDNKVILKNGSDIFVLDESQYLGLSQNTASEIKIELSAGEYFVLGDNRDFSFDSRKFGALPRVNIVGRVLFVAWPITAFAKIELPSY